MLPWRVICQLESFVVESFWAHLPEALQEAAGLRCSTGPQPSAGVSTVLLPCSPAMLMRPHYLPVFTRAPV